MKVLTLTPASRRFYRRPVGQGANDRTTATAACWADQFATANSTAVSGQILSGAWLHHHDDPVGLTQPENYSITVSHP